MVRTGHLALVVRGLLLPAPAGAGQGEQPTTGRVIATITTLEGTVHMPGVQVELRDPERKMVIARTTTDGAGQVTFPDVPPGRYIISVSRPGFLDRDSTVFVVRAGETAQVLLDTRLTFVPPDVEVRAGAPGATTLVQPVSTSDMLSGTLMEIAPLEGDDFRSLLPTARITSSVTGVSLMKARLLPPALISRRSTVCAL